MVYIYIYIYTVYMLDLLKKKCFVFTMDTKHMEYGTILFSGAKLSSSDSALAGCAW